MPQQLKERLHIADAARSHRHVFVRDLCINAFIGVHTHELGTKQPIRINIDLTVLEQPIDDDSLDQVVDYEVIANAAKAICDEGHVNLVETLAERVAATCFNDPRIHAARIRIEKLRAIANTTSVGVEIERLRPNSQ